VGVQFGLFAGAILHLGTERHHAAYLADLISLELLGCFAMTEAGHGSDVAALLTTATYDPGSDEFDLHTPVEAAHKEYIGNAARDGRMAVVFAQLVTGGDTHGVHAFVVPIRDERGHPIATLCFMIPANSEQARAQELLSHLNEAAAPRPSVKSSPRLSFRRTP
jgi:acyl-CoA oxidase